MAEANSFYKCQICGNLVEVIEAHAGTLVCCGQDMNKMQEKTINEEGKEKHVPIVEINEGKVKVKIGSIPHPMEEKHFIELVQLLQDGKIIAEKRLFPEQKPEVEFCIENTQGIKAREICNVHGLWTN